ncbi:MAG: hypothetical protein JW787_04670 [Sedimentisphaerales bacterium]|nr:hypothetical protein [Sedimentisphaerales bacterium]
MNFLRCSIAIPFVYRSGQALVIFRGQDARDTILFVRGSNTAFATQDLWLIFYEAVPSL